MAQKITVVAPNGSHVVFEVADVDHTSWFSRRHGGGSYTDRESNTRQVFHLGGPTVTVERLNEHSSEHRDLA